MARTKQTQKPTHVTVAEATTPLAHDDVADDLACITLPNMDEKKIGSTKLHLPKPMNGTESVPVAPLSTTRLRTR